MPPKASNDVVDEAGLYDSLERLILEKPNAVKDTVSQYSKNRRSQAPDEDSMDKHSDVLDIIISFAPKGLPPFNSLQRVLAGLAEHHEWGMNKFALRDAADKLKLMARHARDLARQIKTRNKLCAFPKLKAIADRIDLGLGAGHQVGQTYTISKQRFRGHG